MADSPVDTDAATPELLETPLTGAHRDLGGRLVPFAGYLMPVQFEGIMAEHTWTREHAGLFDVSHMGQCFLIPSDGQYETAASALERLVPADILALKPGQQRYTQFLDEGGGILDDLMVTRLGFADHEHWLYLVVNAACKDADYAHMRAHLPEGVALRIAGDLALMALQGPEAAAVLADLAPELDDLAFMRSLDLSVDGIWCHVSRTGYTGEDGYEISVPARDAVALQEKLLADARVRPIGLGARDSLRLEAGLCLYGHDIDTTTSPVEADLVWSMQKRRRNEGGFPGFARIRRELDEGPSRRRVGILPEGRAPAREGAVIVADGEEIGTITSGGFGPTLGGPVAMGYVASRFAEPGTSVGIVVRGKTLDAKIAAMPFTPHRYARGKK